MAGISLKKQFYYTRHFLTVITVLFISGMATCQQCQLTFGRMNSLTRHLREKHGQNQIRTECQFCSKTFARSEHYRRHLQTQHYRTLKSPSYPCPVCPNKIFKRKDHLRKHLQSCPTLQKIVNQSKQLTETLFLSTESIDQGKPPATQFFLLEDSAPSEPSAEALFLSTESIDQGKPPATQFFLLEDSASSEPFATQAHFPLLEDIEPSEPSAEALFLSTEAHFPLLEDIEPSEPPAEALFLSTGAHFPLLENIEPSEPSADALFMLETELFDLMNEFFNTISSWEVFKILCNVADGGLLTLLLRMRIWIQVY